MQQNADIIREVADRFVEEFPAAIKEEYWQKASRAFNIFWKLMNNGEFKEINGREIDYYDPIIRILDTKGKRNYNNKLLSLPNLKERLEKSGETYGFNYNISEERDIVKIEGVEGYASLMIPQDQWYNIFNDIASDFTLRDTIAALFESVNSRHRAELIDKIKIINSNANYKNALTGRSAIAISALLCLSNPLAYPKVVSLQDRIKIIRFFQLGELGFNSSYGSQIIDSFEFVKGFNSRYGLRFSPITLGYFLFRPQIRALWDGKTRALDAITSSETNIQTDLYHDSQSPFVDQATLNMLNISSTLSINNDINKQICALLNSGNHIIITGPIGTGKTSLAEDICKTACKKGFCSGHVLTTASSDWSTFETIGGYIPNDNQCLKFEEGKFLQSIRENKWLIIDEINRADIDKAFGQLFTVLSGQNVELPYKKDGQSISIKKTEQNKSSYEDQNRKYLLGQNWRIIATMNVYDMNFLFDMSYAFMRRFAFVYLDNPDNFSELIKGWCVSKKVSESMAPRIEQLMRVGDRKFGPAIAKDMINYLNHRGEGEKELAEAIVAYIVPQLEGLEKDRIRKAWGQIKGIFVENKIPNEVIRPILMEIVGIDLEEARAT